MLPSDTRLRGETALLMMQLLACSFLWASGFILMKYIGSDIPPLALAAVRGTVAAGLLGAWFLARRQDVIPRGREWRDWAVLGALQGAIPNILTAYALLEITTGAAALIQASTPLIVAVLAHLLFSEERLTGRRAIGTLIGFAGMVMLVGPGGAASAPGSTFGTLAMVATAVSYAIGNLYVGAIPAAQPARLALGQQIFSGLPTFVLVLAFDGSAALSAVPAHAASVLALGLFATALPIVLIMHILRTAGPLRGSMSGYLIPFWTLLLGLGLLGEAVAMREIAGGLIVLAGVAVVSSKGNSQPRE